MHEASLMANLLRQILAVAHAEQACRVVGVRVKLGALAHLSPAHLRAHFGQAVRGTVAEGARLQIEVGTETGDVHAQEVILDSLEVET